MIIDSLCSTDDKRDYGRKNIVRTGIYAESDTGKQHLSAPPTWPMSESENVDGERQYSRKEAIENNAVSASDIPFPEIGENGNPAKTDITTNSKIETLNLIQNAINNR